MYFVTSYDDKDCCRQTWGFFEEKETAVQAAHENWGDMHETVYPFVVVEQVLPGLYPHAEERMWFAWVEEKEGFYETETPEFTERFSPYPIAFF